MSSQFTLKRSLSLVQLSFYGLGSILGAGIYVLLGAVAANAGVHLPLAFMAAAVIAALTALSFAELSARLPFSAGEARYVDAAFARRTLTVAVGLAVVLVGMVSSATIVNGFAAYLQVFAAVEPAWAITGLVAALGAIAAIGIEASVWTATTITLLEIAGLVLVIAVAGGDLFSSQALAALRPPADLAAWRGIGAGAVLAFYAFIGFEDMVNVAEEVQAPERTMPRAIIIALVVSTLLYMLVALTAITAVPLEALAGSEAPLAVIVAAHGLDSRVIAAISLLAVVNGALVQMVMAARVLFGLAGSGLLPSALARVHPRTRTPIRATLLVTGAVLAFALALPLVRLATLSSIITLLVFALVNAALVRLRLRDTVAPRTVRFPLWVPLAGCAASLALVAVEWLR